MNNKTQDEIKEEVAKDIAERRRLVKLVATDANPHLPEGKVFEIHHSHKDNLLKNKWAVEEGGETKTKGKAVKPKGGAVTTEAGVDA